jgi:hypothetical protein
MREPDTEDDTESTEDFLSDVGVPVLGALGLAALALLAAVVLALL